ncbi:hypothetical protein [Thalassotalea litorea]|uniref:hypothetical protein n=1 Tax=Thalassotalea litorea TaxID=2020715 RepID=UPI003734F67E
MSNVIQLLERLGEQANLSSHTLENLQKQMADCGLSELSQEAILNGNAQALESLLNLSPNLCNIVHQDAGMDPKDSKDNAFDAPNQALTRQSTAI